ncbi:hypothetical protein E3N88_35885 [Mikania micrantha]|uniref:C2H2-type domain-containing protein n=1 Tax=Mikania micrantha TaxID=192012 RepID=A0A5N6M282_9ASTR|nr:hypothetical protein E3N88_35885 [Mikania micrantha]
MKLKLRQMDADVQDQQNPAHQPQSPFFTEPAMPGFLNANFAGDIVGKDMFRGRFEMRESIRQELEKERIRAEIIAEEMARKRILEAEVRKELMMEREMATRNAGEISLPFMRRSLPASHNNLLAPESLHRQPIEPEDKLSYGHGGRLREIRGFPVSPFRLLGDLPKIKGIPTHDNYEKEDINLGKLDDDTVSGTKRKSTPEVSDGSSQHGSDRSKKKVKEQWNCAICQVSVTSERGFNEHLHGKKHHAKEAALVAQRTGANFGLGVAPKNPIIKPEKLALTSITVSFSGETKSKISVDQTPETSKPSSTSDPNDMKKKDEMVGKNKIDRYKFWCEMCQVGTFAEKVMNAHKEGKKHLTRLVKHYYRKGKVDSDSSATANTCEDEPESKTTNQAVAVETVAAEVKPVKDDMVCVGVVVAEENKRMTAGTSYSGYERGKKDFCSIVIIHDNLMLFANEIGMWNQRKIVNCDFEFGDRDVNL